MERFTNDDLKALVSLRESPCVSIYTATYPGGSEADPVRWKEQLNEAEKKLTASGMSAENAEGFVNRAREYLKVKEFWRDTSSGLATFLSDGLMRLYRLPAQFPNQVTVGPRYEVKPLLPWVNGDGRFYVLALSQNQARMLDCTAHSVQRTNVPGMPANEAEARRTHDRDEPLNYHTHKAGGGQGMQAVYHGQGVGIDDRKDELLHYFQRVDRAVHEFLSNNNSPLVLASVDYLAPIYQSANKYPHLIEAHLKGNPDHLSDQELHDRVWPLVQPRYQERAATAIANYEQFRGTGRTTDDLTQLLPAIHRGEIETLFVVKGREAWGRFDPASSKVEQTPANKAGSEELVNLAVNEAIRFGRTIHLVEPGKAFEGVAMAGMYFVPMNKHGKRP
jgi:release factor family 7